MKTVQTVLICYGMLGFVSIFQGIGLAMLIGGWLSLKEQRRAAGLVAWFAIGAWYRAIAATPEKGVGNGTSSMR